VENTRLDTIWANGSAVTTVRPEPVGTAAAPAGTRPDAASRLIPPRILASLIEIRLLAVTTVSLRCPGGIKRLFSGTRP
jgi:hypothetical protein